MDDQPCEGALEYLRQTDFAKIIAEELRSRREAVLAGMGEAEDEREIWKGVGRIDALDTLVTEFLGGE